MANSALVTSLLLLSLLAIPSISSLKTPRRSVMSTITTTDTNGAISAGVGGAQHDLHLETLWRMNITDAKYANFTLAGSIEQGMLLFVFTDGIRGYNASQGSLVWSVESKDFWGGPVVDVKVVDYDAIVTSNCTLGNKYEVCVQVIALNGTKTRISFRQPERAVFGFTSSVSSPKRMISLQGGGEYLIGQELSSDHFADGHRTVFNVSHSLPNATRLDVGDSTFTVIHYPSGMNGNPYNSQFNLSTGEFLCGFETTSSLPTPTVITGDLVYGGSAFQFLYNATTCKIQSQPLLYLPYAIGGSWYYETENNELQKFDPSGKSLIWSVPINPAAARPNPYTTNLVSGPAKYRKDGSGGTVVTQVATFFEVEYPGPGPSAIFALRNSSTGQALWASNVSIEATPRPLSTILPLGGRGLDGADGNKNDPPPVSATEDYYYYFIPASPLLGGGYSVLGTEGEGSLLIRDKTPISHPLSFVDHSDGRPFIVWKEAGASMVAKWLRSKEESHTL